MRIIDYLVTSTNPTPTEPVTLNEAKDQLRIYHSEQDDLLNRLISAAREMVESMARRALMSRLVDGYLDAWPTDNFIALPLGQCQSVTHVKYTDVDGVESTLDSTTYYVDTVSEPARIVLNSGESWPSDELRTANGIVVRFTAGWTDPTLIPVKFKQAILLLVAHWYKNPEAVLTGSVTTLSAEIDFGVRNLIGLSSPLWI